MTKNNSGNKKTKKEEINTLSFENIIPQIIEEFLKNIMDVYKKLLISPYNMNFTDMSLMVKQHTDLLGREVIKMFMEELDLLMRKDKKRKKLYTIERQDKKSIMTLLGIIEYKRTYYRLKKNPKRFKSQDDTLISTPLSTLSIYLPTYTYLLDDILDIRRHERIDENVKLKLIENAIDMSYERSAKTTLPHEGITRQTVLNALREIGEVDISLSKKLEERLKAKTEKIKEKNKNKNNKDKDKKSIKFLYIEADEDHVSLQSGKKEMAKLVYIHEGRDEKESIPDRIKLKNVHYRTYIDESTDDIWEDVLDYIYENYEYKNIEKIYIAGDGARWIRAGLEWIPKSRFVLDRYHLNKYITKIGTRYPKFKEKLMNLVSPYPSESTNISSITNLFKTFLKKITEDEKIGNIDKISAKNQKRIVKSVQKYITNNWDGIKIYKEDLHVMGPSAEGHIGHVLSDRLSRRPLGWSKKGLKIMAKLRVFKKNNGNLGEFIRLRKELNKKIKEEKLKELIGTYFHSHPYPYPYSYTFTISKKDIDNTIKSTLNKTKRLYNNSSYEKISNIPILIRGKKEPIYDILKSIKYGGSVI